MDAQYDRIDEVEETMAELKSLLSLGDYYVYGLIDPLSKQIFYIGKGTKNRVFEKSEFVERFLELSLFYRLFSPLDSEMICIFPYFCPYAESAREIREVFI